MGRDVVEETGVDSTGDWVFHNDTFTLQVRFCGLIEEEDEGLF